MNEALKNLFERRSCRAYRDEQVKEEELNAVLEAGTYAPTAMGRQSPIIVSVSDKATMKRVERLNAGVKGDPDAPAFYGAPNLVVVFADTETPFGTADANLVIGNILNAANAIGVDSCYIWRAKEAFESEDGRALKKEWGIPDSYAGAGNVILGYGLPEGKRAPLPRKKDYIRKF